MDVDQFVVIPFPVIPGMIPALDILRNLGELGQCQEIDILDLPSSGYTAGMLLLAPI